MTTGTKAPTPAGRAARLVTVRDWPTGPGFLVGDYAVQGNNSADAVRDRIAAAFEECERDLLSAWLSGEPPPRPVSEAREAEARSQVKATVANMVAVEGAVPPGWAWAYVGDLLALLDHARQETRRVLKEAAWLAREEQVAERIEEARQAGYEKGRKDAMAEVECAVSKQ
jgi:hypothetical protein